jgi:hypothetical protein
MPTRAGVAPRPRLLPERLGGRFTAILFAACVLNFLLSPVPPAWADGPDDLNRKVYLPAAARSGAGALPACPETGTQYALIAVPPPPTDRPAARHADLNLSLRGASPITAYLGLVDYGGETDADPPQLRSVFSDHRMPRFSSTHRVYDWNWGCGADGCPSAPISSPPVTLLGMATATGEKLMAPGRTAQISPGSVALVLYAEERRVTIKYTHDDNVRYGYTAHVENICVDPKLLALYRSANAAGRGSLPALRAGQPIGTAAGDEIQVAVRDTGAFLDPRSRKDWWQR